MVSIVKSVAMAPVNGVCGTVQDTATQVKKKTIDSSIGMIPSGLLKGVAVLGASAAGYTGYAVAQTLSHVARSVYGLGKSVIDSQAITVSSQFLKWAAPQELQRLASETLEEGNQVLQSVTDEVMSHFGVPAAAQMLVTYWTYEGVKDMISSCKTKPESLLIYGGLVGWMIYDDTTRWVAQCFLTPTVLKTAAALATVDGASYAYQKRESIANGVKCAANATASAGKAVANATVDAATYTGSKVKSAGQAVLCAGFSAKERMAQESARAASSVKSFVSNVWHRMPAGL